MSGSNSTPADGGAMPLDEAFLMKEIGEHSWTEAQICAAMELLRRGKFEFAPGARRVPPPLLASIKRARLAVGMLKTITELTWWGAGIDEIVEYSALPRKEFYNLLNNKEELFFPVLEFVVEFLRERIEDAARQGDDWRDRVQLGIEEAVRFVVDEPIGAQVLLVESRSAGPRGIEIFDGLVDHFARALDSLVRGEASGTPPQLTPAGVVGGVSSLLYTRVAKGGLKEAGSLASELTQFVLASYERCTR